MIDILIKKPSIGAKELEWVYVAKGLGIILVVVGHFWLAPESTPAYWEELKSAIYTFHMPLFFLLSGFLYEHAKYPYRNLIEGKVRRLMFPFFSIALIFFVLKYVAGHFVTLATPLDWPAVQALVSNPVHSYASALWYLQALFLMFCIYPPTRVVLGSVLVLPALLILNSLIRATDYPVIGNALAYLPYFAVGVMLKESPRVRAIIEENGTAVFLAALVVFGTCSAFLAVTDTGEPSYLIQFLLGVAGSLAVITASILIAHASVVSPSWLIDVGYYSMSIYLFHQFFQAIVRETFNRVGVHVAVAFELIAICAIVAGVLFPMVLESSVLRRYQLTRTLILGLHK